MSVKLRERKFAKGAIKFYLDMYVDGEWSYEFLEIKIEPNDTKAVKSEKKDIANLMRSNRELELLTKNTNYFLKHLKKDIRMVSAALKQFETYVEHRRLKLIDVTPSLMVGFRDYLNDGAGLIGESPHNYFTRFKKILKYAELEGLIKENPNHKPIEVTEDSTFWSIITHVIKRI